MSFIGRGCSGVLLMAATVLAGGKTDERRIRADQFVLAVISRKTIDWAGV
jgi:hypothetical protein